MNRRWPIYLLLLLVFVAVVACWYAALGQAGLLSVIDAVYYALQNFSGEFNDSAFSSSEKPPAALRIMRLVAFAVALLIGVLALVESARVRVFALRRRLFRPTVTLIIGYGPVGSGLAAAILRADENARVIALDRSATLFERREARRVGIELYQANARDAEALATIPLFRLDRTDRILICAGDDSETLAIADRLIALLADRHDRIWLHINSRLLIDRLRDTSTLRAVNDRRLPQTFSLAEATAEHLIVQHRPMSTALACGQNRLHAVVVGFDHCAWRIVEQLILNGAFPPPTFSRPRISVIVPMDSNAAAIWRAHHPEIWRWADVSFFTADAHVISWTFADPLLCKIETLDPPSLYVFAEHVHSLPHALALRHGMEKGLRQPARVFVVATTRFGKALDFGQVAADLQDDIHIIGDPAQAAAVSVAICRPLIAIARRFHQSYRSAETFEQLSETLRISNRRAALHAIEKLAVLGFEGVELARPALGFDRSSASMLSRQLKAVGDQDDMDRIAGMEHGRWCVDRTIDGWTEGPRDDEARQRTQVAVGPIRYASLARAERDKDVAQIQALTEWIAEEVARNNDTPGSVRVVHTAHEPLRTRWSLDQKCLSLNLDPEPDWAGLVGTADAATRIRIIIPPEPPIAPGDANARATLRRDAYRAFADQLLRQAPPDLRFRLLRERAEGWAWLRDMPLPPVASDGRIDGATLPPLTIGFTGPRKLSQPQEICLNALLEKEIALLARGERSLRFVAGIADGADAIARNICSGRMPTLAIVTGGEMPPRNVPPGQVLEAVDPALTGDDRYSDVTRRIVDSCDVLIAVADVPYGGPGGTADTIDYARAAGRPVRPLRVGLSTDA